MRSGIYGVILITLALCAPVFAYDWTTNPGTGDPNDPYQISEPNQLMAIGSDPILLAKHYILTHNIIFDPNNIPDHVFSTALIAPDTDNIDSVYSGTPFTGTFDGSGYMIRNFQIVAHLDGTDYLGVFGKIADAAAVKNLGVINLNILGAKYSTYVGGLCGYNSYSQITSCSATGIIHSQDRSFTFGGLCGMNDSGTIKGSYADVSIKALSGVRLNDSGGLCGSNSGLVVNCHAGGDISGGNSSENLGGLCGISYDFSGEIISCHATGAVSGTSYVGGLCGRSGPVTGSYATGMVSGWRYVGGLCGSAANIVNCYATGNVTTSSYGSPSYIGGLCGSLDWGEIRDCYAVCEISSNNQCFAVGGLCGQMSYGTLIDCYSNTSISFEYSSSNVGGFCGINRDEGNIINCFAISTIANVHYSGGFCSTNFGTIERCSMTGSLAGTERIGGFCGENCGIISSCEAHCDVSGGAELGGFSALNAGDIENCNATGSIDGIDHSWGIGGFCGTNHGYETNAVIVNSYSTGSVSVGHESSSVGGFCGGNGSTIKNCYAAGSVDGGDMIGLAGGFCGYNDAAIVNSYSIGSLSYGSDAYLIGGFCGANSGTVSDSYWNTDTSGRSVSEGGTPLDDPNLMIQTNFAGWDFLGESDNGDNEIWRMCVDGVDYPRLSWEFARGGDFACGDGLDLADLQALAAEWLTTAAAVPATFNTAADANSDKRIDLTDLAVLSENWP